MKIFFVFFAFFMATTFFVYGQNETTDGPIKKIVTNAVPSNITVTESDRTLLGIEFDQIEATVKVRFKCTDKVLTLSSTNQYEIKYLEIENEIAYGFQKDSNFRI